MATRGIRGQRSWQQSSGTNSFVTTKIMAAFLMLLLPVVHAKTCLIMYQMADNNLEYYIRQDYEELTASEVVKSPDLRTWVYYDALNQGGDALPNTLAMDGNSEISGTFTGSRYITYDSDKQKMRVDTELSGEQNSDQPEVIQAYLEYAMADCVSNGFTSLMVVFSSHGGGFAGFGGDENISRQRKLMQINQLIVRALRGALDAVADAPEKVDVLGFDACLMQAVEAADDYTSVANHLLASEAVEPGHGWAYSYLTTATSALDLSKEILKSFLEQTQGGSSHQTPKALAVVELQKYSDFMVTFESFAAELLKLLEGGDRSLHAFVSRSRDTATAFEGVADSVGSTNPSALDLGDWLEQFQILCAPDPTASGGLGELLATAKTAYGAMFVDRGIGQGTANATGMHITWPDRAEYDANKGLWEQVLFTNANYATAIAPNFQAFLEWFLSAGSPTDETTNADSVCGQLAEATAGASGATSTDLIQFDKGTLDEAMPAYKVDATISLDVSNMLVEYGVDLTAPFLKELEKQGFESSPEEYLYLLGGDVAGKYNRNNFTASWDLNFYFLNITGIGQFEALYVSDKGDGSKMVACLFFPEEEKEQVATLQYLDFIFFDMAVWTEKGAKTAFLRFSVDEAKGRVNDNLALYVSSESGTYSEQPRSKGGFIVPVIQIDAFVQDRQLNTLPGGFNQTIISWSEELDYFVLTTPAKNIFKQIPDAGDVVVSMYAFNNHDNTEPDIRYYNITESSLSAITDAPTSEITDVPTSSPTADAPTDSTASPSAGNVPTSTPGDGDGEAPTEAPETVLTDYDSEAMGANTSSNSDPNIFDHNDGIADLESDTINTTITSPTAVSSSSGGQIQQDEASTIAVDDNQAETATANASNASAARVVGAFLFSLFSFLGLLV